MGTPKGLEPTYFGGFEAARPVPDCSEWMDKSRLSKKATFVLIM